MKQMRLNKIGFVQINLQLFTKLFFAVAAVGLLMAPAEKANAYGYAQPTPGSGVAMGMQACPYGTKKANLGGSGNEDIRDANIRINNAKKDRTAARSAQRALSRDIDAVKRDIEEVLQGFASTQIIKHVEGGYGCSDYHPTCFEIGTVVSDGSGLLGGPETTSFFEKLRYDISSLAISTADYIARRAVNVAKAAETDRCDDIISASEKSRCYAACTNSTSANCDDNFIRSNRISSRGCSNNRAPGEQCVDDGNGGNITVYQDDSSARDTARTRGQRTQSGGPCNIRTGENCDGGVDTNSGGGIGRPGPTPESRRRRQVTGQVRTGESTRCNFADNLDGQTDLEGMEQAPRGFCKNEQTDLWQKIIGDEDSASGIDIDALCAKNFRKRGESASDCKAAIQEYLDLREELRLAEQDEAAADALIRAQERLKRSLSREEAREARERARNGETEAGSPYCETGDCGDKKHYSPSASTIFGVAGALAGGLWASSEVNKQQDALAESAVRLGYNPQYYVNPNAAVNAGIGGAITLGSLAYGLAGGAYGCAGGLYPAGPMGAYGPNGMLGVDPTLGGAFGYPPGIFIGNPLGIPGMGGIASYAGIAGGYPGGYAGITGGYPGGIISAIAGGYPGGYAGIAGGYPGGYAGIAGGYPGGYAGIAGGYPGGYAGITGGIVGAIAGGYPGGYAGIAGGYPGGYAGIAGGFPGGVVGGIAGGYPGGYAGIAGGYPGGYAGGIAGGYPGGYAGITGGIVGAIAGGYPGGYAGIAGGFPGGVVGGIAGGYPGGYAGIAGGYPGGYAGGIAGGYPGGYAGIAGGYPGSLAAAYGAAIAGGVAGGIAGGVAGGQYQQQLYQLQQQQYQLQIQQQQRAQQDYVQRMQTVNQLQGELYQIQARIQQIISGGGASAGFSINAGVTGNVGFQPTVGNTGGNVIPTNGGSGQPFR